MGVVARYRYDASNRRISKYTLTDGKTITYYYSNSQVIEEWYNNVFARSYVYGDYVDDVIAMTTSGTNRYYYLKDRQFLFIMSSDEIVGISAYMTEKVCPSLRLLCLVLGNRKKISDSKATYE